MSFIVSQINADPTDASSLLSPSNGPGGLTEGYGDSFTRQEATCTAKDLNTNDQTREIEGCSLNNDMGCSDVDVGIEVSDMKTLSRLEQLAYNRNKLELFETNIKEWYETTGVTTVSITFFDGYIRIVAPDHMDELKKNPEFKEFFLKALVQTSTSNSEKKMAVVQKEPDSQSDTDVPVSCDRCEKSFSSHSQLRKHELLLHMPKDNTVHRCDKCGKVFKAVAFLQSHQCNRTGNRSHQCNECGTRFTSHNSLKIHMRRHTNERPFTCQTCGKGFPRKSSLNYHLTKHTGVKDYQCSVCGKEFALLNGLRDHERIHSGVKPYSCQECGMCFTVSSTLRRHLLIHSGEKPFQCKICNSKFSRQVHLQSHLRVHSGERPYKCNECSKCFAQTSHLKRHQKIHERDRSNVCNQCGHELKTKDVNKHTCPSHNPANTLRQLTFPYNNLVHA